MPCKKCLTPRKPVPVYRSLSPNRFTPALAPLACPYCTDFTKCVVCKEADLVKARVNYDDILAGTLNRSLIPPLLSPNIVVPNIVVPKRNTYMQNLLK